jgi:predicted ferric reductase
VFDLPVTKFKNKNMGNILYVIAVVLIICWAIGFFAYSAGAIIHILLVLAIISILLRVIGGNKTA